MKQLNLYFFGIIALLVISSCASLNQKPEMVTLKSENELHYSLPAKLNFNFQGAVKQTLKNRYHYERGKWVHSNGLVEVTINYHYLSDGYIFSDKKLMDMQSMIKSEYEDRVIEIEEKILVSEKKDKGSFVKFTIEGASCFYYRQFLKLGGMPDLIGHDSTAEYLGDATISGFYCNHNGGVISDEQARDFIAGIKTKKVNI